MVFFLFGVLVISSGCGLFIGGWNINNYIGTWEQDFDFTGEEIRIEGSNGSVIVEVWDEPRVEVTAKWSAKVDNYEFQPIIQKDGSSLSISIDNKDRDLGGVSYVVSVPKGVNLTLRSSNGRVSVSGEALNALDIQTSNGSAMVDSAGPGQLTINTSNSWVRISNWNGEINSNTSNGAITAILNKLESGEYSFITSNGGISVSVDPESKFDLHASTSNGNIRNSISGNWSPIPSGRTHSGSYNGGGAKLTLRSSNSNIQLLPVN